MLPTPNFWRAPLVPVALCLTAGIVLDRLIFVPLYFSFGFTCAAWLAWFTLHRGPERGLSQIYLGAGCLGLGAVYHHWFLFAVAVNDIRHYATTEPMPARVRGVINSEPTFVRGSGDDPLRTFPTSERTRFVLRATHLLDGSAWLEVSGLLQTTVAGKVRNAHVGDRIEAAGRLVLPEGPVNLGGFDYAAQLRDQGIGAIFQVPTDDDAIVLREQGWPANFFGWLAVIRGWGNATLAEYLPMRYQGLAGALLLGEGAGMTGDDWEKYMRTGVIHVLAISGQHLVVLAAFLWFFLRLTRLSRRQGALLVALILLLYALLVGARPAVMRAAWASILMCGGVFFRRPILSANVLAFGWIGVLVANPTDLSNAGCQLSFLAVAVLLWGTQPGVISSAFLLQTPDQKFVDPAIRKSIEQSRLERALERLIDESRPLPLRLARRWCHWLVLLYAINLGVWLAVTPLVAHRFNLISPVALLLGPPLVLLTSIALIGGFMVLFWGFVFPPFAILAGWVTTASLAACEFLVDAGMSWSFAYFYVSDVPAWWLGVFYVGLFAYLTMDRVRVHVRVLAWAGVLWLALGLILALWPPRDAEFRCTFVAVGHGGCTVIETPQGQTLLYDAGAISGPDVTRRHIAPFLWSRGIRHVDEVLLSHADLDHFNGLVALFDRFSVGRISCTPSFQDRSTRGVAATLADIEKRRIPLRILKSGDVVEVEGMTMEVLHPPPTGPEGNENSRSLVLHVRNQGLSMLLTGDLEGLGLDRVLAMPRRELDVLMAPHHGSRTSNKNELAEWARPKVVVSCQGPPKSKPREPNPYEARGAVYLTTWTHGAVTFRKDDSTWIAETHVTGKHWKLAERP
ncbi:MAG: ComEC/Rec2 family competence protein [Planctomycetes bacterium]|nr:ComEC/Rec2 family competence protein [Planctomycetota bacterium]